MNAADPFAIEVRPAPLEHDPVALADAEAAFKVDFAAWEQASAELDELEARVRRHGPAAVPAEVMRAAQLAEEGARRRLDRSRRAVEERRVAAIMAVAVVDLPAMADAGHRAVDQAGADLDHAVEVVAAHRRAHAQLRADLEAAAPGEVPTRLRLTGLQDRYTRLPQPGPDPADLIDRIAKAAARRWTAR